MKNLLIVNLLKVTLILSLGLISTSCGEDKTLDKRVNELEKEIKSLKKELKNTKNNRKSSGNSNESNSIVRVVNMVVPSVVSIHSEKIIEVQPHQYFNPFEDFFFFGNPNRPNPKAQKRKQQGLGSGVLFSKEGHILSNHHVVGDADKLMVTLSDEREFEAEIVGSDKLSDVAVIKIKNPPKNLPVAKLGDSDLLKVGERVIAIGNPFGYSNTVTSGIISAKGRQVGINSYENYLQTDASINPGNSGGALVNLDGELIGVNTAIASRSGASHGIGFAIPINMAKSIVDDLMGTGKVTRGYLGVYLQDVDKNISEALGLKTSNGALITSIIESSPADDAALQEMDLVLSVDGRKIKNVNELRNVVAMLEPKKTYKFKVLRDKKEKTVKVTIGTRDEDNVTQGKKSDPISNFGLTLENINQNHIYRYNLKKESGVIVTDVEVGSEGDKAGLRRGDIILSVNKSKVNMVKEFKKFIKNNKSNSVLILVDRQGSTLYIGLKIK